MNSPVVGVPVVWGLGEPPDGPNGVAFDVLTAEVRTTDKKPPWANEKAKKTNVTMVNWHKATQRWRVRAVDAKTRKQRSAGCFDEWEDAVRRREEVQKTEGTMGPGKLTFTEDGKPIVECGQCRHSFGVAPVARAVCVVAMKPKPSFLVSVLVACEFHSHNLL